MKDFSNFLICMDKNGRSSNKILMEEVQNNAGTDIKTC